MKNLILLLFVLILCSFGNKNAPGENIKTELKWSLCEPSIESAQKKLALPVLKKFARQTYYFDTKAKDLHNVKYTIRLHKENNKFSSILKMDYDDPRDIPAFIPPSMKCEKNLNKDEQFLACNVTHKKATFEKPLTETQEGYLQKKLKKDISLIHLTSFGPFDGAFMKLKYQTKSKDNITLTLEEVRGKSNTIDLFALVKREKDAAYFEEISNLLASKNITLCPNQKNQLPAVLDN